MVFLLLNVEKYSFDGGQCVCELCKVPSNSTNQANCLDSQRPQLGQNFLDNTEWDLLRHLFRETEIEGKEILKKLRS